jgi:hypothetical protein
MVVHRGRTGGMRCRRKSISTSLQAEVTKASLG